MQCWVTFNKRHSRRIWYPNSHHFPDIGQNWDVGISDFWIFGQFFINQNCHNSRTSHHIDMKLGAVTKLDRRNASIPKKFNDDVMSASYGVIFFRKKFMEKLQPSGGRIWDACSIKLTFSLIITFYLKELENITQKTVTRLLYYYFE